MTCRTGRVALGAMVRASLLLCALLAAIAAAGCQPPDDPEGSPASPRRSATAGRPYTVVSKAPPASSLPACTWAETVRVIDGDTIVVRIAGAEDTVRYIGVDTPETSHPTKGVEPFGAEATAANRTLVEGRRICLESDITERDRYSRLLRYAWLENGTMVNEALLALGLAQVVTYPPDVKYVESRYLPAQRAAREAGLGIWSGTAPGALSTPAPTPTPGGRVAPPACYQPGRNTCDCKDFTTHASAQAFHDALDPGDINRLDADRDGLVCESLP